MNTEFNWWLLIVGLVIGAGLVWLVLADGRRREADLSDRERESEARWIGESMRAAGRRIDDGDALDILRLHEAYLAASPPDNLDEADEEELAAAIREARASEREVAAVTGSTPVAVPPATAVAPAPAVPPDGTERASRGPSSG